MLVLQLIDKGEAYQDLNRSFIIFICLDDIYVRELDNAVKEAKKNREWRHEYMTLLMRDQANQKIGMEMERQKIIIRMIGQGFTNSQIIMLCNTTEEEIEKCRKAK